VSLSICTVKTNKGRVIMEAYFGKKRLKKKIVKRAETHQNLGTIQQGQYGEIEILEPGTAEFRGCAVGCLTQPVKLARITDGFMDYMELEAYVQAEFGKEHSVQIEDSAPYDKLIEKFNFSAELCSVIEAIFESLSPEQAKDWPLRIVEAIPVGADVSPDSIMRIIGQEFYVQKAIGNRFGDGFGHGIDDFGFTDSFREMLQYEVGTCEISREEAKEAADEFVAAIKKL
jgi:hypothetical protein